MPRLIGPYVTRVLDPLKEEITGRRGVESKKGSALELYDVPAPLYCPEAVCCVHMARDAVA